MKVEIFAGNNTINLQKKMNIWLSQMGDIEVLHMLQSESDGSGDQMGKWSVTITLLYRCN